MGAVVPGLFLPMMGLCDVIRWARNSPHELNARAPEGFSMHHPWRQEHWHFLLKSKCNLEGIVHHSFIIFSKNYKSDLPVSYLGRRPGTVQNIGYRSPLKIVQY